MSQTLELGGTKGSSAGVRRLNRLPVIIAIGLVVLFIGVIFYGLSQRGLYFGNEQEDSGGSTRPATTYADELTRGIPDAIIGEPAPANPFQLAPPQTSSEPAQSQPARVEQEPAVSLPSDTDAETSWLFEIEREQQEQVLREMHRQRMARLQADETALNAPIAVDLADLDVGGLTYADIENGGNGDREFQQNGNGEDVYSAAMRAGLFAQGRGSEQAAKQAFFNQDLAEHGYLDHQMVEPRSPYELKRGSVIAATLITGINSDLPGLITAQVSQNVYDSATGRHLLIPQGARLLGRYDSEVSYGQSRVLVIWTDLIFPNGSSLMLGGMPGVDVAGYGGFTDEVDNHFGRIFGSAVLVALIGAGTEMMLPQDRNTFGTSNSAEDAARRSFAETFGQTANQAMTRNFEVQPTLQIRPGYRFNILVERDIVFPSVVPSMGSQ